MKVTRKISRRDMLKATGLLSAGALLAACGAQPTPDTAVEAPAAEGKAEAVEESTPEAAAPPPQAVVITFMGELNENNVEQFNTLYADSGVTLESVEADEARFFAMLAAGTPPDLMRTQAPSLPQLVGRGIALNIQPYIETSSVIDNDDIAPGNAYYRFEDAFHVGTGDYYGMVKDWNDDFALWANKTLLEERDLPVPSDTEPMSYTELADLAAKATAREGNQITITGYLYHYPWLMRMWMLSLLSKDMGIFSDDFSRIILTDNEEAVNAVRWWFDMAAEGYMNSPLHPPSTWAGGDFVNGLGALFNSGYWFTGFIGIQESLEDEIIHIPAAIWDGGKRLSPTHAATGTIIVAATPAPDAAWTVFEWYHGGEAAVDRAKSGWGIPPLKSLYDLLPEDTPLQQQSKRVMLGEIKYADQILRYNPYLLKAEPDPITAAYTTYLEPALLGDMTFEEMLENIENDVNAAIQDGIDRMPA